MRPVGGAGGGSADLGNRSDGGISGALGCGFFVRGGGAELTSCCGGAEGTFAAGAAGAEREANASPIMPPRITIGRVFGARFFGFESPMEATFSMAIGCGASTIAITDGLTLTNFGGSFTSPPKRSKLGIGMAACCAPSSPTETKEPGEPRVMIDGLSEVSSGSNTTKDDAFAAFVAQKVTNMVAKNRRIDTPAAAFEPNSTTCGTRIAAT